MDEKQAMTYEERESKLDQILGRLDDADVPIDDLVSGAREAVELVQSMRDTLRGAEQEISDALAEIDGDE